MKSQPNLRSSFVYDGETIKLEWFDAESKAHLKGIEWQQVYAIGNVQRKVPIVHYAKSDRNDNLPGGHIDAGENVEQALKREMQEELNMEVLSWQPLGYQKLTEPSGRVMYQLRVYAKLKPIAQFSHDPGGDVTGYSLVELDKLNESISYADVGEIMIDLARKYFDESS